MIAPSADAPIDRVISLLKGVRETKTGWTARCPAHDDSSPSLSVSRGSDGRVLMICRAHCPTTAIVAAIGLTMADLFVDAKARTFTLHPQSYTPPQPVATSNGKDDSRDWPVVREYDYVNADGALVFQVQRKEPTTQSDGKRKKTFRQRQQGPNGWLNNLDGIEERPLYRLPELLEDLGQGRTILLVEGEKDCDTARSIGYSAAAHAGGANGWRAEYAKQLSGASIVILPDNDTPGREWAAEAGAALCAAGASVHMLALPITQEGADLTDWVNAGGTAQQLDRLLSKAIKWSAGDPIPLPLAPPKFKLLSVQELEALPPMEWLVGEEMAGVLPAEALSAIFGAPGSGKSFIAADLACSIASRRDDLVPDWFKHSIKRGPVLYVVAEGGKGFRHRVLAWRTKYGVAADELDLSFVLEPVNLYSAEDISHILRAADLLPQPPALVVFDTLARSMVGGDENSAQDIGTVIDRATRVIRETGASVNLVHHSRKDSDVERGSTALRGAVDTLCLVREDEESGRVLTCEKQKDADPFLPITFYLTSVGDSCVVSSQAPVGSKALTSNQRAALQTLGNLFDRGATATEWLRGSGISDRTFYRVRAWLVREGYVSEQERGQSMRYSLTQSGRWALGGIT